MRRSSSISSASTLKRSPHVRCRRWISGATYLHGTGVYTNAEKKIVMIAIKKHLYPKLKDIVREADPRAFRIVSGAKEIYGEGFQDHLKEDV